MLVIRPAQGSFYLLENNSSKRFLLFRPGFERDCHNSLEPNDCVILMPYASYLCSVEIIFFVSEHTQLKSYMLFGILATENN